MSAERSLGSAFTSAGDSDERASRIHRVPCVLANILTPDSVILLPITFHCHSINSKRMKNQLPMIMDWELSTRYYSMWMAPKGNYD